MTTKRIKPCRIVEEGESIIRFYGNGHFRPVKFCDVDWSDAPEAYFDYKGNRYFVSDGMWAPDNEQFRRYDRTESWTIWSGICYKFNQETDIQVQVWTYIC